MNLSFDISIADGYKSNSQKARVMTEAWFSTNMFCPKCGYPHINHFENNRPVADFYCNNCNSQFELKSKNGKFGRIVADGAYNTMISRITTDNNPDFMFMGYSLDSASVTDLYFVPKHFFTPSVIEKRAPLADTARRAGWVGCNILFDKIPKQGRISIITNGVAKSVDDTVKLVTKASLLKKNSLDSQGWLYDVLNCVNSISKNDFSLNDIYKFEPYLQKIHPENSNIKAKIRQQLQFLRDAGFIMFLDNKGNYRKVE